METPTTATSRPTAGVQKRRKPSGETSHVCPFCARAFKRSEHKERHVRTHTKEKPFVCHCGSAFTRRDLLTRHQRIATHEKRVQDALGSKAEQAGMLPSIDANVDLNTALSPSDVSISPWDQQSHLNSTYHTNGNAPDEHQVLDHQLQQSMIHQEYYQGQQEFPPGQEFQSGYGDFDGLAHFDDSTLPIGWSSNSYFAPPDTGEDYVDPQLQETISISI